MQNTYRRQPGGNVPCPASAARACHPGAPEPQNAGGRGEDGGPYDRRNAPEEIYRAKTARWQQQWPSLTVLPWPPAVPAGTGAASGTSAAPAGTRAERPSARRHAEEDR